MKIVTAAVIEKDGRILIAQRLKGDVLEGKWEFPGGKAETGETHGECLQRELKEEFDINVEVGEFICSSKFKYEHAFIELFVYRVKWLSGSFKINSHEKIKWVKLDEMQAYDFSNADIPIVNYLISAPNFKI
ncbi:MAG: (deoxy)nucleoside triphosphate pyrophosphohydrolase [Candidatus Omnitrophica bacterium]|nr:(deoxy)nucleoside triphosphate pyrophosphohydrolase [Candidatus Omnitrophota bacterium]